MNRRSIVYWKSRLTPLSNQGLGLESQLLHKSN